MVSINKIGSELSLKKHNLVREIERLNSDYKNHDINQEKIKQLNSELEVIEKQLKENLDLELQKRQEVLTKMEEEKNMIVDSKRVSSELRKYNAIYKDKIQEYRDLIEKLNENKAEKIRLREIRVKLHGIKKQETISEEDKKFILGLE
mgnify:CR=1 FL=1